MITEREQKQYTLGCMTILAVIALIIIAVTDGFNRGLYSYDETPKVLTAREALYLARKAQAAERRKLETNKIIQYVIDKVKQTSNDGDTSYKIEWEDLDCKYEDWIEARDNLIDIGYTVIEYKDGKTTSIKISWNN